MIDQKKMINGYPLLRSNRRSISITVSREGQVTIHAPLYAAEGDIRAFVEAKKEWIEKAQGKQQQRREQAPVFAVGSEMPYLGRAVLVSTGDVEVAQLHGSQLILPKSGDPRRHALNWLAQQARELLPDRITQWSKVMGIYPSSLTIANPKTRWGSMKSDGSLRLNVALMHCDPALIDYVIVHELSHMRHMDHSPAFHAHVARYLPDAENRRKALKQLGGYLTLFREG